MKKVFSVFRNDEEKVFLIEENALQDATLNGGELVEAELSDKKLKELIRTGDIEDIAEYQERMTKPSGSSKEKEQEDEQAAKIKTLEAELAKAKKMQSLSFEDAAKIYAHKAQVLKDIAVFENTLQKIKSIDIKPSNKDSLNTDGARIVYQEGSYNSKDILSINNVFILSEFNEFISVKIANKINELKEEVKA